MPFNIIREEQARISRAASVLTLTPSGAIRDPAIFWKVLADEGGPTGSNTSALRRRTRLPIVGSPKGREQGREVYKRCRLKKGGPSYYLRRCIACESSAGTVFYASQRRSTAIQHNYCLHHRVLAPRSACDAYAPCSVERPPLFIVRARALRLPVWRLRALLRVWTRQRRRRSIVSTKHGAQETRLARRAVPGTGERCLSATGESGSERSRGARRPS